MTATALEASSDAVATFRELAALFETLTRTRSRLELARHVADFLGGLEPADVGPAVRLLLGRAGRGEVAVSGGTLWPILVRLAGDDGAAARAWEGAVDFGEAAERLMYRAGLALRFARIARIREDKTPEEADTIEHLRALFASQQARGRGGA